MSTEHRPAKGIGIVKRELIGSATLYLADCECVIPFLPAVGVVITSPPYNLGAAPWKPAGHWSPGRGKSGSGGNSKWKSGPDAANGVQYETHSDAIPWHEYVAWQRRILSLLWSKLSATGAIFFNHKPRVIGTRLWLPTELLPPESILRQIVVWARPGGMNYTPTAFVPTHEWVLCLAQEAFRLKSRGVSGMGDVWRMTPERSDHPAPFPLELPAKIIEATAPTLCTDPFMGSGTVGVACAKAGIPFFGIEKDSRYFDMACERIKEAA